MAHVGSVLVARIASGGTKAKRTWATSDTWSVKRSKSFHNQCQLKRYIAGPVLCSTSCRAPYKPGVLAKARPLYKHQDFSFFSSIAPTVPEIVRAVESRNLAPPAGDDHQVTATVTVAM
eukprot:3050408-Rhodomonas_salina.4